MALVGAVLWSVLWLPGCFAARSTFNEPLRADALAALRPGETTARDVVEQLGAPTEIVQLARRSAYRYDFTASKRAGLFLVVVFVMNEDTRADRVWVFFDEDDVLTHVGATFAGHRTEYAAPWEDLYDDIDQDAALGEDPEGAPEEAAEAD